MVIPVIVDSELPVWLSLSEGRTSLDRGQRLVRNGGNMTRRQMWDVRLAQDRMATVVEQEVVEKCANCHEVWLTIVGIRLLTADVPSAPKMGAMIGHHSQYWFLNINTGRHDVVEQPQLDALRACDLPGAP